MSSELENHAALQNWRVIAYGAVLVGALLAAWPLANTMEPSETERCSIACNKKMKSHTASVPGHWVPVQKEVELLGAKGIREVQAWADTVPQKCECEDSR